MTAWICTSIADFWAEWWSLVSVWFFLQVYQVYLRWTFVIQHLLRGVTFTTTQLLFCIILCKYSRKQRKANQSQNKIIDIANLHQQWQSLMLAFNWLELNLMFNFYGHYWQFLDIFSCYLSLKMTFNWPWLLQNYLDQNLWTFHSS